MWIRLFVLLILLVLGGGAYISLAGYRSDAELIQQARGVAQTYCSQAQHPRYVTLIDYRRSILAQRLAVVDTRRPGQVVVRARVSHAWNSGLLYATRFSNEIGSERSSLGAFLTQEAYEGGAFGYSMRLRGLSPGLNTNARHRAVVFHSGYTYSAGCFMTAPAVNRLLINLIKNGSLVVATR
jgi:hypothetical protein